MRRAARDALIGALLSAGAPAGLAVVRLVARAVDGRPAGPASLLDDVWREPATYAYVTASTFIVLTLFGLALGLQADALSRLARADVLTGLATRRAFEERFEAEAARVSRAGTPLSLLLVDLDSLKAINDQRGHRAGDAALVATANGLLESCRRTDFCARWGGDEFVVLAPDTDAEAAWGLAERCRERVVARGGSVSIGLTTGQGDARTLDLRDLLVEADAALYEAKRAGRGRVMARRGPRDGTA